ncbi:MAG: homoaconitate hydratase [Candidatus Altiarchaeales archaeon ex4484_2]|nr:MAG: homoaconitate hydratase [Candidatus Altiarchaeales archaeon ex4484_2]
MSKKQKYLILDNTLRDGEQMPGVVFTPKQKIELAKKASRFGVDYIDIMPAVSDTEKKLIRALNKADLDAEIIASTMMGRDHVDIALDCGVSNIALFTALSDLHLKYKMRLSREDNMNRVVEVVDYAVDHGLSVFFAGEDASRADLDYVVEFVREIEDRIECFIPADTLGCLTPMQTYGFFRELGDRCSCRLGLHVHNDFGLATANTLAGLKAGAVLFSGTFTGIGERAGNAPLEEVCVALRFLERRGLGLKFNMITDVCRTVERYSGVGLQHHKPLVGLNAFSHESGIHADGVIKKSRTYENFEPGFIGRRRRFLFGKHSGRAVVRYVLEKHGISDMDVDEVLVEIKGISSREQRSLTEGEVLELVKRLRHSDALAVSSGG